LKKRKTKEIDTAEITETKSLIFDFLKSMSGRRVVNIVTIRRETKTSTEISNWIK